MAISIDNSAARIAARSLVQNQAAMQTSLRRLATGYRINSGADDPAGLIASERLRSEEAQTTTAIDNAQRADQVLATAEGGLSEIANLLVNLQSLIVASANRAALDNDELDANQLQVDSILHTIDRLSNATSFGGRKLLTGELGYQVSGGAGMAALQWINVHSARAPAGVTVEVLASAQHAALLYQGGPAGLSRSVNVAVAGNAGMVELSFASGATASAIVAAVNPFADSTGVTASASANDVAFISTGYGAAQFVSVQSNNSSGLQTTGLTGSGTVDHASGRDATLAVNGQAVRTTGLAAEMSSDLLDVSFMLDNAYNRAGVTATFGLTGGATFALSPNIDSAGAASIGLNAVNSNTLGGTTWDGASYTLADLESGGKASLRSGNLQAAQQVVDGAIRQVSQERGRIGAFRKYTIQSQINLLSVTLENLSSAESSIRDTDFAAETAELTRQQILVAASQSVLTTANQNQQTILKLLGQ